MLVVPCLPMAAFCFSRASGMKISCQASEARHTANVNCRALPSQDCTGSSWACHMVASYNQVTVVTKTLRRMTLLWAHENSRKQSGSTNPREMLRSTWKQGDATIVTLDFHNTGDYGIRDVYVHNIITKAQQRNVFLWLAHHLNEFLLIRCKERLLEWLKW